MLKKINIEVLNVGDGDSIIVCLEKFNSNLVILIDGGKSNHSSIIIHKLDFLLSRYGKKAPDIIVCTHYDYDHIGGLCDVVENYRGNIGEIWLHKTIKNFNVFYNNDDDGDSTLPSEKNMYLTSDFSFENFGSNSNVCLENASHELRLLKLIKELSIKHIEPYPENVKILGWEEVKVIGPTVNFYNENCPSHFYEELLEDDIELASIGETNKESPFKKLDESSKRITKQNLTSVIILIEFDTKKFLLTGDAGIPSFKSIPDYNNTLRNIFWLKIPHHGSVKNLNSELLELMRPEIAVISGNLKISEILVECLNLFKSKVSTTKNQDHLSFSYEASPEIVR